MYHTYWPIIHGNQNIDSFSYWAATCYIGTFIHGRYKLQCLMGICKKVYFAITYQWAVWKSCVGSSLHSNLP